MGFPDFGQEELESVGQFAVDLAGSRRRPGIRLGCVGALPTLGLLALMAGSARAAVVEIHAAPTALGSADRSSPANACMIETAIAEGNAASVADSVRIKLAGGPYALSGPEETALVITFEGPGLALEAEGASATVAQRDPTSTARAFA